MKPGLAWGLRLPRVRSHSTLSAPAAAAAYVGGVERWAVRMYVCVCAEWLSRKVRH